jgi:hypothetical protein
MFKHLRIGIALLAVCLIGSGSIALADTTDSTTYGSGLYGVCDYGACSLTLTSSGTVTANIVPSAAGKCSVQSDTVSVLTDNPSGYSVTMTTSTANNAMVNGANSIAASSGTAAVPATLSNNTWGYRIDGLSGFGAGPTTSQSSGSIPSVKFAAVPASGQSAATVATSSSSANPAVNTTVWYGVCSNTSIPSGNYSATVTYTAVTT